MKRLNAEEPFHTIAKLPAAVEAVKKNFGPGQVFHIISDNSNVAVSAALNLLGEIAGKAFTRRIDVGRLVRAWAASKSADLLKDHENSMGAPVLALYYFGKEFNALFASSEYRMNDFRNWLVMKLSDRVRQNRGTIIASSSIFAQALTDLFGSYGILKERFITVNLNKAVRK